MNRWLQTKIFTCPKCSATYTHDRAYRHSLFACPKLNKPVVVERAKFKEKISCTT